MVVVWFTGAKGRPTVKTAVSRDGGASFSEPLVVDGERPTGRVDVALSGSLAWLSWLGRTEDGTAVLLRPLDLSSSTPGLGHALRLSGSSEARSSGFPRVVATGDRLVVAWVDVESAAGIRTAWLPLGAGGASPSGR